MGAVSVARASFMALDRIVERKKSSRSGSTNRTRAHVHPHSRLAGTFEDDWFYSYAKGEPDRIYARARDLLKKKNAIRRLARSEGRELTADEKLVVLMTGSALRVLEALKDLARLCAGKVFPTWHWIEQATGLSRATVGRALAALTTNGLIEKQRRCVPIDPPADRPKAKNAQTSNVYRLSFPNRLVRFLTRSLRPVPLPDDLLQSEADRIDEIERMRLWRSPRQVVEEEIHDEELRDIMLRFAAGVERQESQKNGQPLVDSYISSMSGVGLNGQRV